MMHRTMLSAQPVTVSIGGKRYYQFQGRKFVSVTTALSFIKTQKAKDSMKWARIRRDKKDGRGAGDRYMADAMLLGTYAHYWLAADLCRQAHIPLPEFEPERPLPPSREEDYELIKSYWDDFKRFARPSAYSTAIEKFVWHSSGWAGRIDAVLKLNFLAPEILKLERATEHITLLHPPQPNDVWVVDFKTGAGIYETYPAQVYAYKEAFNERCGNIANRTAILWLSQKGWEFREVDDGKWMWRRAMSEVKRRGLV